MAYLPRLGVNIDHIATLRQLRGTPYPSLLEAARIVEKAGGAQITVHLREDRRHIQDEDVRQLRKELRIPLNLEMAATEAMTKFALKIKPEWDCIVPEKRAEVTTEGGLALEKNARRIGKTVERLKKGGIKVSLFVEPSVKAMKLSAKLGADAVELHTGRYCLAAQSPKASTGAGKKKTAAEFDRIREAGLLARDLGLHVHAGHGFDYANVRPVAELVDDEKRPLIEEYNIGHAIVCRAAIVGLDRAVKEMVSAILAP
ncbi:MAG: pyridoxine 5'-phosphate synthase [Bdellovibrionales bacterium]|nr:pyridoxine 5'-phosphate synthase [Bdellovibrionales bacterium]